MNAMADDSAEIFDDLYLGLRAGGALRKQRRGEPLTPEEEEALGRWQRLSTWRKALAVGGFALGTFGLGFTLGGLVFGRAGAALARFFLRPANITAGTSSPAGSMSRNTTSTSVASTAAIGIASST